MLTYFSFSDLNKTTWERLPSHLVLPMMLMRENFKNSMIQTVNSNFDQIPSVSSKARNNKSGSDDGGEKDGFACGVCGRVYKLKSSLRNHQKWECGKEPQFQCPYCVYKAKQKMHMSRHMERMHKGKDMTPLKIEIKTEQNKEPEKSAD